MKHVVCLAAVLMILAARPLLTYAAEQERPATTQEMSQEKAHYEKTMEERLRKLGKQLDEIKARASATTKEARKNMDRYLADAEKKQKAATRKLAELRKESAEKWKKFASEMDAAADDFAKAYERAKSHFKE